MKKQSRKLTLNRETLRFLDHATGGLTHASGCLTITKPCGDTGGGGGTYASCWNTCDLCSNGCATGGACSVTCSAQTSCC
jgi:hypothetical protein